jgi:ArsR family metal-binding transcriptional regulator
MEFLAVKPCRHDAFEAVPKGRISLDLDEAEALLKERGYQILSNPKVMLVVKKDHEITVYPHGRLLMHPVKDRGTAEQVAKSLYAALGL